ncbi:MAG: hypothetical protein AB9903_14450 [Vulcanimicrobiota bacterium]
MNINNFREINQESVINHPKVKLLAQLDGTDSTAQAITVRRLDEFERTKSASGDDLDISAQLYRNNTPPKIRMLRGTGLAGIGAAASVAMGLALSPWGILPAAVGFLVTGGAMTLSGLPVMAIRDLWTGYKENKNPSPEPDWSGKRVYDKVEPDKVQGKIDSGPVEDIRSGLLFPVMPDVDKFSEFLTRNFDENAKNVIYLAGHGMGYQRTCSMKTKELANAIETANSNRGVTPAVLFMESCHEGNYEGMSDLRKSAEYAIVSEEMMQAGDLPLEKTISEAVKHSSSNEELAKSMFSAANANKENYTMALINLRKMPELNDAMESLATLLTGEMAADSGMRDQIRAAEKKATKFPNDPGNQGKVIKALYGYSGFSDLGGFFNALGEIDFSDEIKSSLVKAKEALAAVVVDKSLGEGYENCSGLSFQIKPKDAAGPGREKYSEVDIPQAWKDFITVLWK